MSGFCLLAQEPVYRNMTKQYSNVAKAGELQSRGVKGEAVVDYREPLTTKDLKLSGFPVG